MTLINTEIQLNEDEHWLAKEVTSYIIKYLSEIFHGSIILREFGKQKTDIMVLDENLPVEIQTNLRNNISGVEDSIRRQVELNIKVYGRCWIFLDEKFLSYLNNITNKTISINLDWLYQLWKSEKVRIFTVTYNGIIKEMIKEDWKFLPKLSQTCKISSEEDNRILQKNKAIIFYNVVNTLGFTTDEITNIYNSFKSRKTKNREFAQYLRRDGSTMREVLYSDVYYSISSINDLNKCMCCMIERENIRNHNLMYNGSVLGLLENSNTQTKSLQLRIRFSDKYNVAKYFPGYIKNKEMWDYLKTRWLNRDEFYGILTGIYHYSLIKKQKTMLDY